MTAVDTSSTEAPETVPFVCPPDHRHDETHTCRNEHGCHCEPCVVGKREYNYWLKHMLRAGKKAPVVKDALGMRRRLQALGAIGWSTTALASRLDTSDSHIREWRHAQRVTITSFDKVARLYEEVSMHPVVGHDRRSKQSATRSRNDAARQGWLPPLAWDDIDTDPEPPAADELDEADVDEIAVDRALRGEAQRLNKAEKREAVRRAHPWRWSDMLIASTIGISDKTVTRIREELELPAWPMEEIVMRRAA